mmetsp:Transcript_24843/g.83304  ORF Transcript_24843/g.83304 Transcript_24843/m.83304 type:complete len:151 (+) Transcript_24843:536-988(+)
MTAPLIARKTAGGTARIEVPDGARGPRPAAPPAPAAHAARGSALTLRGRPSKVVLLRNMANPHEVDESLSEDVRAECQAKYGDVVHVAVHIASGQGTGADAVRVLVKFARQASAMKAYLALDGRYFNERQLAAWFFPEDAFDAGDYERVI